MSEDSEKVVAQWRDAVQHIERLRKRSNYEYVSKGELRSIARHALEMLHALYVGGLKHAEEAAQPESQIVLASSIPLMPRA